ncbi:glycosyltransferase family 9 protein [Nisaea acidiphila]|uniref:Glycosyltransferase family 9 protein n=1 Tax=Nisaea acidiphila TaxID=1862145 RepID=A0A9J7AQB7_9PROT|nr:glycosyltransferase family 9 protein [Nisaea acidiphila]UUX49415.1 glycosyltransferase family 9 protein [Nisaea acidiphila]
MRILFISHTRLGDAVLSTGLLGALMDRYPEARFTIACGPVAAPVFESFPALERLVVMRKGPCLRHWRTLLGACFTTFWDLIVDLRGSASGWVLPTRRRRIFSGGSAGGHRVEQLAGLFEFDPVPAPRAWFSEADKARADLLSGDDPRPILAVGPTANWRAKTWPLERFEATVRELSGAGGVLDGARLAVLAAPQEREAALPLLAAVPEGDRIDLAGTEPLGVLTAMLARSALYIGNDSGLMHLAAATGAPTLGLFGPSRDEQYRPWGRRTAFVRTDRDYDTLRRDPGFCKDPDDSLMWDLPVDRVVGAAAGLLAGKA